MQCAFCQVHSLKFVAVVTCFINKGRRSFSVEWLQTPMTASIHSIPSHALVRNMRGWYAILLHLMYRYLVFCALSTLLNYRYEDIKNRTHYRLFSGHQYFANFIFFGRASRYDSW